MLLTIVYNNEKRVTYCSDREEITTPTVNPISAAGINTFKFGQDLVFDVYIQYREYMCFVKCMEALRGMKLMHINKEGKAYTANIRVRY